MTPAEAITRLREMQSQIIHGKNTFGDIADVIERLEQEWQFDREFRRAVDYLRRGVAESLTFHQENDDPPPRHAIECNGEWTDWKDQRFEGVTIRECLDMAVAAKEEAISAAKG